MRPGKLIPLVLAGTCASSCAEPPSQPHLGLLAPLALQPILDPVVAAWESTHGARVRIGFDSPDRLLRQADGGTRADVFISADIRWMDALVRDGHVDETHRVAVAYDPLIFASPPGSSPARDPRDLVAPSIRSVGLGQSTSPEGQIARMALQETMVLDQLSGKLAEQRSHQQLRERLESGELHAAVTMQSAMLLAADTVSTHEFSPDLAFGSVVEVAPLLHGHQGDRELTRSLVVAIAESPEARAGWSAAGLEAHRNHPSRGRSPSVAPESRPRPAVGGPPPSSRTPPTAPARLDPPRPQMPAR